MVPQVNDIAVCWLA